LTGPARADEAARAALARATARTDAADRAFDTRRAELDALARTAETAAAEFHRVRAATDRLTRWHRLHATAEGRRRLDGLPEPAPVTYAAPPKPPPPATAVRPPTPRYTPSTDGARLTSPDHLAYTVHEVPRDGDAFFHALAEGLARTAPALRARHGIDPADPGTPRALRRLLAARLTDPADADLLAAMAPDDTDVFTAAEIDATGPAPDLTAGTPGRREFDQLGVVPHAVRLDATARAALGTAQLNRRGDADDDTGWDHAAADLLPLLAARTFGIDVTVVLGDGTFQTFTPGDRPGSGRLQGLVEPPETDRPHVVLVLDDRHYRLAVPDPVRPPPPPVPEAAPPTAAPTVRSSAVRSSAVEGTGSDRPFKDTPRPAPTAPTPQEREPRRAPVPLPVPLPVPREVTAAAETGTGAAPTPADTGTPPGRNGPDDQGTSFEEALLAALGDESGRRLLNRGQPVPVADLARTDVSLTAGQAAHAVLLGGSLTVDELGLTPLQHLRWLLGRRVDAAGRPGGEASADVAAAARILGIAIEVTAPGGRTHRYGSASGDLVRLLFDGSWSTTTVP
ncbi:hypothetical protein ABT144_38255, partial [Streptomyces sp. NPDC002039]